jgi:hypothetical protein
LRRGFAAYNSALCACGRKLKEYEKKNCISVLKGKGQNRQKKSCLAMWMLLNQKNPLCICPVSGSNKGGCGVPMHLDLYTGTTRNGLTFPAPAQRSRRRRLLGEEVVEVLDANDKNLLDSQDEPLRKFAKWVKSTVTKHAHIVGDNVVWEGVIPPKFGDYLQKNCDKLEWKVKKFGLMVEFKGLTFRSEVRSEGTRRRLLSRSNGGGC